jgi:hypothetical protein
VATGDFDAAADGPRRRGRIEWPLNHDKVIGAQNGAFSPAG